MRRIINKNNSSNNKKKKDNNNKDNFNIRGRPRKGVVSFQIEEDLWQEFDKEVEETYGRYKKSLIIESLIRQYMMKKSSNINNNNNKDLI